MHRTAGQAGWTLPVLEAKPVPAAPPSCSLARAGPSLSASHGHLLGTTGQRNSGTNTPNSFLSRDRSTAHCWGNRTEDSSYPI